jgi:outer membrane protein W
MTLDANQGLLRLCDYFKHYHHHTGVVMKRIDVKKVFFSTSAKFSPSGVRADMDIDPWLIGVGIGYKF